LLIGSAGTTGLTLSAELAPEVAQAFAAGRDQQVIVHLAAGAGAKEALGHEPGAVDRRRQRAVEEAVATVIHEVSDTLSSRDFKVVRRFRLQPAVTAVVTADGLAELLRNPRVESVEPDRRVTLQTLEGLNLIGADSLHQLGVDGEGTAVAIIDSGVDYLHPTLGGGQIPNAKIVFGLDTADHDQDPMDCIGHGTAVASVAAGSSYQWSPNRRFAGGVAPAAKILAYKVTADAECGIATTGAVIEAIEDAILRRHGDGYRLAAINISLGAGEFTGPCDDSNLAYSEAIRAATEAGITVVAAAGNSGYTNAMNVPACITGTIAVGSAWDVDPGSVPYHFCLDPECHDLCDDSFRWKRAVACYSNSSPYLDLIAPSEYLKAAAANGVTVDFGGTSGAAAYVTGAAALLAQALPDDDPQKTKFLLAATGRPTMDDKNGLIRPIIDLVAAVNAADEVFVSADFVVPIRTRPFDPTVSSISIDQDGVVGNLEVLVDLVHPAPEFLRITLSAPGGTEVVLHEYGLGFGGIAGTYPDDLEPVQSLSRFAGLPIRGTWTLTVEDHRVPEEPDDGPNLNGWALKVQEPSQPPFVGTTMIYPVVAHSEGAQNTFWRSDVRLFNAEPTMEAEVRLLLIPPSGEAGAGPWQTDVIVPHGSVVALDDIVEKRFGLDTAHGSLVVQDAAGTLVHGTSRTYTTSVSGTYGQFVPATVAGDHSTGAGEPALIVLPTPGLDRRVNIGFTETTGHPARVAVTLLDSQSGVAIGSSTFHDIEPYANIQINGVLPDSQAAPGSDPYVAVAVVQGAGRVTAYGSTIDNRTGDAVFVTGTIVEVTPYLLIPVVANKPGQAGTEWRSDIRVLNHSSFSLHIDAELRFQGALGLPPVVEGFELQPGEALTIDDVVGGFFGFSGVAGSLRLVPREGPAALCATSRTANFSSNGTYGQYVPGIRPNQGLRGHGVLLHLDADAKSRSNLGILETGGTTVEVEIRLFDALGRPLGSAARMTLGPWESIQINDIFTFFGVPGEFNARIEIASYSGTGGFFAYGSVIDSDSGDAIFVPVLELP
jgi:subtilisin family serine protease/subtilisin-like proprotein convertase family protein